MTISRFPTWIYTAIAVIPGLVFLSAFFIFQTGLSLDARNALMMLAILWALPFAAIGWKRLDEPGREAHKFAWFYGAGFGLIVAMLPVAFAYYLPVVGNLIDGAITSWASKWPAGQGGFALGVMFTAVMQIAGWAIVWSAWWLVRRR